MINKLLFSGAAGFSESLQLRSCYSVNQPYSEGMLYIRASRMRLACALLAVVLWALAAGALQFAACPWAPLFLSAFAFSSRC